MDVRVSLFGWSPVDRLHRSVIAQPFAVAVRETSAGQKGA